MPVHDDLGRRMKENYEGRSKTLLLRRCPVIIRLDGKVFHSFTRGFDRPFDGIFLEAMRNTMKYLCENIEGTVLGYHQSDEISLCLTDYKKFGTQAWFDYEVQKLVSVSASMASGFFNKELSRVVSGYSEDVRSKYFKAIFKDIAVFDARAFNVPREEVANYFYWRQLDAIRNSIQMVGQSKYSPKQLNLKSCEDIKKMLLGDFNIDWGDYATVLKRGSCCVKDGKEVIKVSQKDGSVKEVQRDSVWRIDLEIPVFRDDRDYIDKWINCGEGMTWE